MKILYDPDKYSWIKYIKHRIRNNKNFLVFTGGPTGVGKSWSNLSIAQMLNPKFTVKDCVFRGKDLMRRINSGQIKSGMPLVFDEAGIDLSNRSWQSTTNRLLNALLQTFRHKRIVLLMNSPYMDFVDASTRKLFHAEFQILGVNKETQTAICKPQLLQFNARMSKFYYHYLKIINNKKMIPVKRWNIPKPSDGLVKEYEKKKTAFTKALNEGIYKELEAMEKPPKKQLKCYACGHHWIQRGKKEPDTCPRCRISFWRKDQIVKHKTKGG
ncbi:AAA family ATPase [archaeon]|nr:AAA family ATPase [archaeon]